MTRQELVRRLVLRYISDDYQNVDQYILSEVACDCAKLGFTVERPDIVKALAELIEQGLAMAYLLSGRAPFAKELPGMPSLDIVETWFETYFYITKKGMDLHLSDDSWWPFDEDGNPLMRSS